jgi:hypothetical protein
MIQHLELIHETSKSQYILEIVILSNPSGQNQYQSAVEKSYIQPGTGGLRL